MLVGVTGYAQHGKDSVGARLVDSWGYTRFGFADPLKAMALAVDPVIPYDSSSWDTLSAIVAREGWEGAKSIVEVRRFLQVLGTEGARGTFGEDCWVHALEGRIVDSEAENVVVTDVRFPNEARWLHRHSGVLIRVIRPGWPYDPAHASERYVPELAADFVIDNGGDLADLAAKVDAIAADLEEGFTTSWQVTL
jgi:hypothetical protein